MPHIFRFGSIVGLCLSQALAGWAADSLKPDDSRSPYADEIRRVKDRMGWRQTDLQWLTPDFEQLGDFGKADLRLMIEDFQRLIGEGQKAIDAYHKGDVATARRLGREAERARETRDWRVRLDARRRQAESWPSEHWFEQVASLW